MKSQLITPLTTSAPPVRYPPPLSPSPSPSLSLHQASEAKLHLINNGCCCLLHRWSRAATLGNAGATFNWMGLLMRPAGETPPPTHIHTLPPYFAPPPAFFKRRRRSWVLADCGSERGPGRCSNTFKDHDEG